MKKLSLFLLTALLLLVLAACGTDGESEEASGAVDEGEAEEEAAEENEKAEAEEASEITVTHELGETVVPKNPESVVVFDFGVLDTLDTLGVEGITGIPQGGKVPEYLSEYAGEEYENVGTLVEADFETVHALDPELIIISGRQSDNYDEFSSIAPTIYSGVDTGRYVESFEENVEVLAEIFEKEAEAEEALAEVHQSIEALNEDATADDGKSLVVLANEGSVSAYGPSSRYGMIHDNFGFEPVDENIESSTHGQSISYEYISENNPDYMFVIDRGAAVGDGDESSLTNVIENELVQTTEAYKNDKILYLDPEFWYLSGGGLTSVQEMVNEAAQMLE
ncbi:siderophore ABC transporter substrate-binding protein [Thalassorhabdus alkalitolerans]|uniref:Siderophore ABC transporter substrate-binding protein n=1 Tax=Thalassorhabdus alkalitolerans TaxID=2282697 RepID=A0ABW0YIP6_9BACI